MRIGVVAAVEQSMFSSGTTNASLAVAELMRELGHDVRLVHMGPDAVQWWDDCRGLAENWRVNRLADFGEGRVEGVLDVVFEIGRLTLSAETRRTIAPSGRCIWVLRQPYLLGELEASIFPQVATPKRDLEGIAETWIWDAVAAAEQGAVQVLELLTRRPVRVVPYVWTPTPVATLAKEVNLPPWIASTVGELVKMQAASAAAGTGDQPLPPWSVHIAETNGTNASSAVLPLVILREAKRRGIPVSKFRVHNSGLVKQSKFFMENIVRHCTTGGGVTLSGEFVDRQICAGWACEPMSCVLSHLRFSFLRPMLLDLAWVGVPTVHNSVALRDVGYGLERLFYSDNHVGAACDAMMNMTTDLMTVKGVFAPDALPAIRERLLARWSPLSVVVQKGWQEALQRVVGVGAGAPAPVPAAAPVVAPAPAPAPATPTKRTLRLGFCDMWDQFNPSYNFFTLALADAGSRMTPPITITAGPVGVRGDVQTLGNVNVPFGSVVASNLDVRGTATFGSAVTMSNTLLVASNLSVGSGVSTVTTTATTLAVTSSVTFQDKYITYRPTDLLFSDTITVPGISTNFFTASNSVFTSNLTVTGTLTATGAPSLQLSSTAITNPAGSLTISSIAANSATFSNLISTVQLQASSLTASTLLLQGNIVAAGQGYLNIGAVVASTISTGVLAATTLLATNFATAGLAVDTLVVASTLTANNLATFSASNATIDNRGGTFITGTALVRDAYVTSSITNVTGIFSTPATTLRFTAPTVAFQAASISSLQASTINASTLNATQITIGAAPPTGAPNGPSFSPEFTYPSTNVTITGGPGDYLTPYFLSNVKPAGVGPGDPYTVDASFQLNFNGPQLPGYYASILGLTLFPAGESNSQISIRTYNDSNTLVSLYGLFGTNQTYATPPNTGGIPVPADPLPSSFIHITGTMYGNSAFSLQFQSRSNDNFVGIDSNNTITINNGVIRWPYYLNGTTIQNSLNDMSVRTLYYYGGLNFASDPALKEAIEPADLGRCYDIVHQIPLRRYRYNDAYVSTFHPRDVHRLGILATELEPYFPNSITYTQLEGFPSTVRLVDTQQLDMAHIGATKVLMQRVETLEADVAATLSSLRAAHEPQ